MQERLNKYSFWIAGILFFLVLIVATVLPGRRDRAVIRAISIATGGHYSGDVTTALPGWAENLLPESMHPWFERVYGIEVYTPTNSFPTDFSGLSYLESFTVHVSVNPSGEAFNFANCKSLETVYFSENSGHISSFRDCRNLTTLVINSWGDLGALPDLSGCEKLEEFSINVDSASAKSASLALPNLTSLSLYASELDEFPDFSECPKLMQLEICTQSAVPMSNLETECPNLSLLSIYGGKLEVPSLKGLRSLSSLTLGYFQRTTLPELEGLTWLEELILDGMPLESLPQLPQLDSLHIHDLPLSAVPEIPQKTSILRISDVPFRNLKPLSGRTFSSLRIESSHEFGDYSALESVRVTGMFRMSGGKLSVKAMESLFTKSLGYLRFWHCDIEAMPDLSHTSLLELSLEYVPISEIPANFLPRSLVALEIRGLENVRRLPDLDLPDLESLILCDCPIEPSFKISSTALHELVLRELSIKEWPEVKGVSATKFRSAKDCPNLKPE